MKIRRTFATIAVLGAALACFASTANASPLVCTIPTSVTLNVLPDGCAAILTNGPITFTGVHGSNSHNYNVEIDDLLMFGMNTAALSAQVALQGVYHDLTTGTNTSFSYSLTNFFETSPDDTTFAADTLPHTFGIAHFINPLAPGITFKLNFGEAGRPDEGANQRVTSSADTTTSPGNFTVSSFFDVFTELTLDGGNSWRVADNDFVPGSNTVGTGSILQLENNPVPEPASIMLLGSGLLVVARRMRKGRRINRHDANG